VDRKFRSGFRGYPIATVAFYGPNDKLATKVVVSVFLTEGNDLSDHPKPATDYHLKTGQREQRPGH
jgi:hypothetical protein